MAKQARAAPPAAAVTHDVCMGVRGTKKPVIPQAAMIPARPMHPIDKAPQYKALPEQSANG